MSGADNNRRTIIMRTVRTKVYTFNELTQDAQKKAIERFADINTDTEWYQCTIEDFKSSSFFDIDNVFFSGFYSQGDGAMFEYSGINKKFIDSIIDTLSISTWKKSILKKCVSIYATGKHRGRYYHEKSCSHNISIECTENAYPNIECLINLYSSEIENGIIDKYEELCIHLYKTLEKEYNFLTSEEAIKESIIANGYEFTKNGEQFYQ